MNTFYEQRPEQLFIGTMTDHVFPAHVHSVAELVVMTRGSSVMTIDDVQYRLNPGDAAVVFPLVPHSYPSAIGEFRRSYDFVWQFIQHLVRHRL